MGRGWCRRQGYYVRISATPLTLSNRCEEAQPHGFDSVNAAIPRSPVPHSPSRIAGTSEVERLWWWLLLASVIFVVYGSLVPLNYQPMPWAQALARFMDFGGDHLGTGSRVDKASNVLLTIPVAFAAAQCLLPGRSRIAAWLLRAVIVGGVLLLTVGVEFAQLFFPPRTMSWSDVVAQILGTLLGLLAQQRWGAAVSRWLLGWWRRERSSARLSRVLKGYLAVLLGFSLLPLDLTINPVELYHKWAGGRVIFLPFAGLQGDLSERLYECITDVVIWLPVGVFLFLSGPLTWLQTLVRGLLLAAAIELLQLFVFTRVTDITDVLLAGLGVVLGRACAQAALSIAARGVGKVGAGVWLVAWLVWLISVLVVFWWPFHFRLPADGEWMSWLRVPFSTYQLEDEYRAVNEVLRRIGFFLPGGVLWFLTLHARATRLGARVSGAGVLVLLCVALVVEAGQVFLPVKVADLTDAGLAFLGGALGFRLARWLASTAPSLPREPARQVRRAPPAPETLPRRAAPPRSAVGLHLASVAALGVALSLVVHLPGVPYNVRELIAVGPLGLVSSLSLAASMFLLANAPMWLLNRSPLWVLAAPLALPLMGALCFALLRLGVPLESIHDVVGSPVLDWPWEWELLLRFMALWTAIGLQVGLACLMVGMLLKPRRLPAFVNGLLLTALLAYPLYWAVVDRAATDNLVELMANQASFAAASWLAVGALAICLVASSLSALIVEPRCWRALSPLAMLAMLAAPLALVAGLEQNVIKYEKVFSALQFLLSTDRSQYASGFALWSRFAAALVVLALGLAMLQHVGWRLVSRPSVPAQP